MEFKLESGDKVKFKEVSIDERDMLMDSFEYNYDEKGQTIGMKMMQTTITKWIRTCVKGGDDDKLLKKFSISDRTNCMIEMQKWMFVGEEKPSDSK